MAIITRVGPSPSSRHIDPSRAAELAREALFDHLQDIKPEPLRAPVRLAQRNSWLARFFGMGV